MLFRKFVLSIVSITFMLVSSSNAQVADYYSRWKFDGDFSDSGIGGNHGTKVGNPVFVTDKDGNSSDAVKLDGSNDYVRVGNDSNLSLTTDYTVSFWINPYSYGEGGYGRIIEKRDNSVGSGKGWAINLNQGNKGINVNKIGGTSAQIYNCVDLNQWQMFTFTHDGSILRVYKNGAIIDSMSFPVFVPTDVEALIGQTENGGRLFEGLIDDIVIYQRVLTSSEVEELYDPTLNSYYSRWKFDGDFSDSGIGGNHGTKVGNPVFVTDKDGNSSGAVKLDGSNDYVRVGNDSNLSLTTDYTVSFWINPYSYGEGGYGRIIEKRDNSVGSGKGWAINLNQNNKGININKIGGTSAQIYNCVDLNQWQMFTFTHDGSILRVYKNGAIIDSMSFPVFVPTDVEALIGQTENGGRLFKGLIDDIVIYQKVLISSEVEKLYDTVNGKLKIATIPRSNDVDNTKLVKAVNIFPNPSNGNFKVNFALNDQEEAIINIYDIKGVLVKAISTSEGTNQISLEDVCPGIYMVKVHFNSGTITQKIIIK